MSNFNFTQVAKDNTVFSEVMAGREKVSMDDILKVFPEGVTVVEFDLVDQLNEKGETDHYCICAIAEDEKVCFFGGMVLTKICDQWASSFPSVKEASDTLKASGGVKMKFKRELTKNKRNVTTVEIL